MNCTDTKLVELIQGVLTAEESKDVLHHLKTCPSCGERVKVMAVLEKICPDNGLLRTRKRIFLLAAGVFLLALVSAIVTLSIENRSEPNNWVRITEAEPYPYFPIHPRSEEPATTVRKKAFQAYIRGDYQFALQALEQLEATPEILFFRGVCEYFSCKRKAAYAHFSAAASRNERWRAPALWYQANLLLGAGEPGKAKLILEELRKSGEEYASEATSLLNQLDKWPIEKEREP